MKLVKFLNHASLVTLPVSKELICKSGKRFYGHTEELEKLFGKKTVMCMYHPDLSVIPLTHHIPLKSVPSKIKNIDWATIARSIRFFSLLTKFKKEIGMTGLNPHAGENGEIGDEEEFLKSAIKNMSETGLKINGPYPADGLFIEANRKKYSLVLAMYHDQALIPFKALYGTSGLNITLNLPFLRVSPDHGPAYDFAGKNSADIQSVYKSLVFAMDSGEKWIKLYSSL
jgi:4-hydroxythreonine-4-phosphate dehydrogenase